MRERRIRMSRAGNRMMQDVPGATVVVTNPTHLAIALRYERGRDPAPVVVAKGADLIALRIRAIAEENNVPVMENKPLARALHKAVEVGEVIPPEHFEMAAKVISVVLARAGKHGAPHPN
jgi:flagellar biosynthetic protein FlhB